ncbi:response regulator transcription factor [Kitasatospora sp. NPDC091207]|uniref:response regulator transcription factor n=1 Tax=Kitasatospora sp. NPDC091207 TaxID=3364083 RepID=UPI00380A6B08
MRTAASREQPAALVIEDDEVIGGHLHAGLLGGGYTVFWCRTGASGVAQAGRVPVDVVLLDLGLPDVDGVDVARRLRCEHPDLLIVILTARSDDIDVIAGLDAGADDYLVKPFSLTVLLARLRAHLRRFPPDAGAGPPVRVGDLVVDTAARRCLVGGRELALRPKEFDLLEVLARYPERAVAREELMARVWDENWFGPTKTLDVTMASLRRRLRDAVDGAAGRVRVPVIETLRGHGYRLHLPAPAAAEDS